MIYNQAYSCDFSSIKQIDGGFLYPPECHRTVGNAMQERKLLKQENEELRKAITFKDLAINEANVRADTFQKVAMDNTERMHAMSSSSQIKDILTFSGGVVSGLALGIISTKIAVEVIK
jgi:hypothetical protein